MNTVRIDWNSQGNPVVNQMSWKEEFFQHLYDSILGIASFNHELIAKNGVGPVYKATNKVTGNVSCVKYIPLFADNRVVNGHSSEAMHAYAKNEKAALERLIGKRNMVTHGGVKIVPLTVLGQETPLAIVVTEYINGSDFFDYRSAASEEGRELAVPETFALFKGMAQGLDTMDKNRVVHNDVSAQNFMVPKYHDKLTLDERAEAVRVIDFGLAVVDGKDNLKSIKDTGRMFCKPPYASKEVAQSLLTTHKSDIFSLGTVVYMALLGENPFLVPNNILGTLAKAADHDKNQWKLFRDRLVNEGYSLDVVDAAADLNHSEEGKRTLDTLLVVSTNIIEGRTPIYKSQAYVPSGIDNQEGDEDLKEIEDVTLLDPSLPETLPAVKAYQQSQEVRVADSLDKGQVERFAYARLNTVIEPKAKPTQVEYTKPDLRIPTPRQII